MIFLDFPIDEPHVQEFSESEKLFGYESRAVFCGQDDYLFIFDDEKIITEIKPNFELLSRLDKRGAIISARSENYDFVSRCFFPNYGIDEDPVTGSAHTLLAPYWSLELNKKDLIAKQLSKRGGILHLTVNDDRVDIGGRTSVFLKGEIIL